MRALVLAVSMAALVSGCATKVAELKADPSGIERAEVPRDYKAVFADVRRYAYDCFSATPSAKPSGYLDRERQRGEVAVSADYLGTLLVVDIVPAGAASSSVAAYYGNPFWQKGARRAIQAATGAPPDC